jgi:DNA-binding LytR/AlgR family response regulator
MLDLMNNKIKILIVEDEKPAQMHLCKMLENVSYPIEVVAMTNSIAMTINYLQQSPSLDLIFMDIHLTDGISFSIFDKINIITPIIFTTAYDEYALRAFKVNSIDYLLKPIDEDELQRSVDKFHQFKNNTIFKAEALLKAFQEPPQNYQERFLVHKGERLLSILAEQIAYFEGEDRYVYLVKNDGSKFIIDAKLADLEFQLNPKHFFKLNRSFIANFSAIQNIVALSRSRVKVELQPKAKREIIVSTENTQTFKNWLNG